VAQLRVESQVEDASMTCRYSMGPRLTGLIRLILTEPAGNARNGMCDPTRVDAATRS
jgi:hypothetical protein